MSETVSPSVDTAVVFTCGGCGHSVVLRVTAIGVQIDDVPTFMRVHAQCLKRVQPANESIELPD